MRNKLFQQVLDNVSDETRQNIRNYTDLIDHYEDKLDKVKILLEACREAQGHNCIAFGEWLLRHAYERTLLFHRLMWYDSSKQGEERYKTYTTEQLYQIYLNENEKNI